MILSIIFLFNSCRLCSVGEPVFFTDPATTDREREESDYATVPCVLVEDLQIFIIV